MIMREVEKFELKKPVSFMAATDEERAKTAAKLQPALDAAQKGARVRTIDIKDMAYALDKADKIISGAGYHKIAKKAIEGTEVVIDCNAQTFPNAYKGAPESTFFSAVYHSGKWQITALWRGRTASPRQGVKIKLSDAAKAAIIAEIQAE